MSISRASFVSAVIFGFAFFVMGVQRADAATLQVPQQYPSIAKAVSAAKYGDTVLVSAGTYYENLDIRKNIDLKSVSGAADTVINGGAKGTVVLWANVEFDGVRAPKISGFTIKNGLSGEGRAGGITLYTSDVVIENNNIVNNVSSMDAGGILVHIKSDAVIRNNFIDSNSAQRYGAGIYVVNNSNPLIYNNHISNNNASGVSIVNESSAGGGAIFVTDNSSPQIIKNTIISNHADHAGGAISLRANANSIIEDNFISENSAAYGGGIHLETEGGTSIIRDNIITNNQANLTAGLNGSGWGGGISVYNKSYPQIVGNEISNNFATQGGGGIVNAENAASTITGNRIFSNKITTSSGVYTGGGIHIANSSAVINNNVIYSNEARIGGGIGLVNGANANIENNTIVKNKVPLYGGGISVLDAVSSSVIKNNIITQNDDYQIFEEHKKSVIRNNLINNNGKGIYFNWDIAGITDIGVLNSNGSVDADANVSGTEGFVDVNNNNYKINSSSSGIDKGASGLVSAVDIDHVSRLTGSAPDAGAYEYAPSARTTYPMYRFWSDSKKHHFYTIEKSERDAVLSTYFHSEWKYEGIAFRAYKITDCQGGFPVHRFWSDSYQGHFYTISESEKEYVKNNYDDSVWRYEGAMYCADTVANVDNKNLHRFWSDTYNGHFYTADEGEKDYVIANYPDNVWRYEGPAFRVYSE